MAEQELLPCPFGGEEVTISRNWYPPAVDLHCHCPVEIHLSVTPKHDSVNSYDFDTAERELQSLWNTRALLTTEQVQGAAGDHAFLRLEAENMALTLEALGYPERGLCTPLSRYRQRFPKTALPAPPVPVTVDAKESK